jgi:hypothetical protein
MNSRHSDAFPITALVPDTPGEPIIIYEPQAALRIAIAEREFVGFLDSSWEIAGVYCLLYPISANGEFQVYIGKAPMGLRGRVSSHLSGKVDGWVRAVLMTRDTTHGFSSAQVGWLEGRLWSLVFASANGTPSNKNRPKDETLPDYDRAVLETYVIPIGRILRLLGYGMEPEGEVPVRRTAAPKVKYGVTVADLLAAELVTAGDTLVFTYPGHPASAVVQADGAIVVETTRYETLSAAAGALRGGPTNGWQYWATTEASGNQTPMADLRARFIEQRAPQVSEEPITPETR